MRLYDLLPVYFTDQRTQAQAKECFGERRKERSAQPFLLKPRLNVLHLASGSTETSAPSLSSTSSQQKHIQGSGNPADRRNEVEVDAGDTLADLNAEPEPEDGGIRDEESL